MIYLLGLICPVFSFILQTYPRFFNKYFGVDVWTRLIEIEQVKKAHHNIPTNVSNNYIIKGYFDYPIVFPWLLSFFPKKSLLAMQGFISPFFDCFQNYFVFALALSLTNNVATAIFSQIAYTLTPMIPIENSYMTPRSLGYFLFTLSFFPMLYFNITHQFALIIISFIFTCLLFLTHRFALQSLIFIDIVFTLIDKSPLYILVLLSAFIFVTIISKGYYLRVLKGHLFNIYFWVLNYNYRFAHQIYGNTQVKKQDWVGKIYQLMSLLSPIMLFGISLWTISGILYLILVHASNLTVPKAIVFYKLSYWVIFCYLFAALVLKIKRLIPIGEGQRYLEMATVPSSILTGIIVFALFKSYGATALIIFILLCLINLTLIIFIQIKGIIKDKNRSLTHELSQTFTYINKLGGNPRIMCIPHQITTMTIYHTRAKVLVNADNPGLMKITDFYPVLRVPIDELKKKYLLDYIILRESFVSLKELKLKKSIIRFRSGDILLIKI